MRINERSGYCPICAAIYYGMDRCPFHGILLRKSPRNKRRVRA